MTGRARAPESLAGLSTPGLVVDRERLDRNLDAMETRARDLGVALRPHLKTAKSQAIAERTPSARSHGATVSTVFEAESFAPMGLPSILLARTAAEGDLERIARLNAGTEGLLLAVDSIDGVALLETALNAGSRRLSVLVEIDSGEHRSGLDPQDPELRRLLEHLARSRSLDFRGVFTHGGHSYTEQARSAIADVAESERASTVAAAELAAELGLDCAVRSVGSTPTAVHARTLDGCTELRCGVYVFQDLFQAGIGSCSLDDLALSVLTTVIGRRPKERRLLIDAGGLALSKDRSTGAFDGPDHPLGDCGYGLVADLDGEILDGLVVVDAYQEHGLVEARPGRDLDVAAFPLGTKLRVFPNHACMTAAAHGSYSVVEGSRVVDRWSRINGWG